MIDIACSPQGVEGISLGCTFLDANFSQLKYILFGACYVIITPIGIGAKPNYFRMLYSRAPVDLVVQSIS